MILDIIFPERCLYCKKVGKIVCDNCLKKINNKYLFKKVNNKYFDYFYSYSFYNGETKKLIHAFKFYEKAYLYKYFIGLSLRDEKIYMFLNKYDLITYVPMTLKKQRARGYNQSRLLANELGRKLNTKVEKYLNKTNENKIQNSLSEKERIKNVENIFDFNGGNINNKNIILVDDILTTGATVNSCSKILKENGAKNICVYTIAKTSVNFTK